MVDRAARVVPKSGDPFRSTPYRLVRLLGEGSSAVVYEVERARDGRVFAAKVLRPELAGNAQSIDRMRIEVEALGRLRHRHIVRIHGFDQVEDGRPFLVLERLAGSKLEAEALQRSISVDEAVGWTRELLSALSAAHAIGVVHRDVNLHNLFLHGQRDRPVLKVIDFGFAKVLGGSGGPRPLSYPTEADVIVGARRFVAPETVRYADIDERVDLYAAGLVLHVLLTGQNPYAALFRTTEILHAHVFRELPPPSAMAPVSVPAELDDIVKKALAKDPEDRFQSADEFDNALARLVAHRTSAPAPGPDHAQSDTRAREECAPVNVERGVPGAAKRQLLERGERVKDYEIVDLIASGGFGDVYEALHTILGRRAAIKILQARYAGDEDLQERFLREARILARIQNPHLVTVYDADGHAGRVWMAMEFLEGRTLREMIRTGGTLPLMDALNIATCVADGVSALHARDVVHRDLKPENVFQTVDGRVVVMDLGAARLVSANGEKAEIRELGTAAYMSPEQLRRSPIDQRTDVYALALTLYEMLSGTHPFARPGMSSHQLSYAQANRMPAPIHDLAPWVPEEVSRIVEKGLQKERRERHRSMREFRESLSEAMDRQRAEPETGMRQLARVGGSQGGSESAGRGSQAPTGAGRILCRCDAVVVAEVQRVCVVIWHGAVTETTFEMQRRGLAEVVAGYPDGVGFLCVVEGSAKPPKDELRRASSEMVLSHGDRLKCVACVMEGHGFMSAVHRSVLAGMVLLLRHPQFKVSVFSNVAEAGQWMSQHVAIPSLDEFLSNVGHVRSPPLAQRR